MEDAFGKVFAILLGVVLTFALPLQYTHFRMNTLEELFVLEKTVEFVDSVRNTGKISKNTYEIYHRQIENLSNRYKIKMSQILYEAHNGELIKGKLDECDIENVIYGDGADYLIGKGEYFKIQVERVKNNRKNEIICSYGGYIQNEIY